VCNQLACILLICVYTSIFYKLDDDICYSSFHPLFLGACIWHSMLSFLNTDDIDLVREAMSENSILFCWWSSYSYWWVMTRDGSLILFSICALIGLKYSQLFNNCLAHSTISIVDDNSSWDFIPETYTSSERWRERRFCKFRFILRRVGIGRGMNNHRSRPFRHRERPRHHRMRRFE
jgi:hypothetical protein